jgi:biotin transport system substrate-specific component
MEKKNNKIVWYILCAFFAALTAVFSQVSVPLPFTPVPISLASLAVLICGGVLGAKRGALAMVVYVLLGAVGLPVFANFSGGAGVIAGPTGGYIIGYIFAAAVMGLFSGKEDEVSGGATQGPQGQSAKTGFAGTGKGILRTIAKGVPAMIVLYAFGTAWFVISTGTGVAASLLLCVVPFIPGDILKIIAAAAVCEALKNPLRRLSGTRA